MNVPQNLTLVNSSLPWPELFLVHLMRNLHTPACSPGSNMETEDQCSHHLRKNLLPNPILIGSDSLLFQGRGALAHEDSRWVRRGPDHLLSPTRKILRKGRRIMGKRRQHGRIPRTKWFGSTKAVKQQETDTSLCVCGLDITWNHEAHLLGWKNSVFLLIL